MAVRPKPLPASPTRRRRQAGSKGRIAVVLLPVMFGARFLNSADVHWYIHLLLIVFAAALPPALICAAAVAAEAGVTEQREQRRQRPRPTAVYLLRRRPGCLPARRPRWQRGQPGPGRPGWAPPERAGLRPAWSGPP